MGAKRFLRRVVGVHWRWGTESESPTKATGMGPGHNAAKHTPVGGFRPIPSQRKKLTITKINQ